MQQRSLTGTRRRKRIIGAVIAASSLAVLLFAMCYVSDDDIPTPQWLKNLSWALTSNETKGQWCGAHGDAYLDRGDYDLAIAEFNKSLGYYPLDGGTHYDLGLALYKKGRVTEACVQWREVENPDEEFVSDEVREDQLDQSEKMLTKCHQGPKEPPKPIAPSPFAAYTF